MNGTSDRIAFERLQAALLRAEATGDLEALERSRGEMDAFVASLVLDPCHDGSYARLWLAWLDDSRLHMLQRVLTEEVNRRREAHAQAVYAPRRRPARAAALARLFG
jgi:hypothetical protein